jgi:hypothetical protein
MPKFATGFVFTHHGRRVQAYCKWPKVLLAAKTYASVFYDKLPWPIARGFTNDGNTRASVLRGTLSASYSTHCRPPR